MADELFEIGDAGFVLAADVIAAEEGGQRRRFEIEDAKERRSADVRDRGREQETPVRWATINCERAPILPSPSSARSNQGAAPKPSPWQGPAKC